MKKQLLWAFVLVLVIAGITFAGFRRFAAKDLTEPKQTPVSVQETPSVTPTLEPTKTPNTSEITLLFGGDIMLGRTVETKMRSNGVDYPFSSIAKLVASADIAAANLESPIKTDAKTTDIDSLVLRGYPQGLDGVKKAGFDLVSLANNHITDMGLAGLLETQSALNQREIAYAGAGETEDAAHIPVVIEKSGVRFGFLSYTYGVNFGSKGVYFAIANPEDVTRDVAALRAKADVITVFCHCGVEYMANQNATQEAFAHAAIDAGANLVVGHHPHVPEPVERYKNGVIVYSLGNLVFDQAKGNNRDHSAFFEVKFKGSDMQKASLIPYNITDYSRPILMTDQKQKQEVWKLFKVPEGEINLLQ